MGKNGIQPIDPDDDGIGSMHPVDWRDQRPDDAMVGAFDTYAPPLLKSVAPGPFREAMSRMESADAIIRSADESLRITRNRYESGLSTATDLLRTENALVEARLRRLSAIYDQRLAAIAWALATGNLNGDANVLE